MFSFTFGLQRIAYQMAFLAKIHRLLLCVLRLPNVIRTWIS